ncbi:MAG: metallophosphoesterase [Firmicutes bacterium]|nr:metallophosphoesterase [Bacillota bacterium]
MTRRKAFIAAIAAIAILATGFACPAWAAPEVTTIKEIAGTAAGSFSFLVSGDPQLGADNGLAADRAGWLGSLANATGEWDNLAFLLTVGDNVNNAGNEEQFAAFLEGVASVNLPLAPTQGNHDPDVLDEFDLPNKDSHGNYWYTYGGVLFLHLNSNYEFGAIAKTVWFLLSAAWKNRDAGWKIAVFHHPAYAAHHDRSLSWEMFVARFVYAPLFDLLGVDLALQGHQHHYARSKPMKCWIPCKSGIPYVTLGSGSGSKYYNIYEDGIYFIEAKLQPRVPMLAKIDVTPGALKLTACRTDTMEVLDTYTVSK